jgi:hypothetical protein
MTPQGRINGIAVEGELITVRPPVGMWHYTGTLRVIHANAEALRRLVIEDGDNLVYEGPASGDGQRSTVTVLVMVRVLPGNTHILVQSSGATL